MDGILKLLSVESLSDPVILSVAGGVLVAVVLIVRKLLNAERRPRKKTGTGDKEIDRLIKAGKIEAAANLLVKKGDLVNAMEYFLSAQKPARAAQMAERMNDSVKAAELYERAGDKKRAAALYKAAGMKMKAAEIMGTTAAEKSVLEELETRQSPEDMLLTPQVRARRAESKFVDTHIKAKSGDAISANQLTEIGKEAVEALLSAGETRRAAEICVESGLYDQAINLFVNLLGDPGSAAPLLAKRGDHKRAAELFESAGKKERALAEWIDWSNDAPDPLENLNKVERLGDDTFFQYLNTVAQKRPVAKENVDLHYRIADAYEQREKVAPAITLLESIYRIDPGFRDVRQRIVKLKIALKTESNKPKAFEKKEDIGTAKTLFDANSPHKGEKAAEALRDANEKHKDASLNGELDDPFADLTLNDEREAKSGILSDNKLPLDQLVDPAAIEKLVNEVAVAAAREVTSLAWSKRSSEVSASESPALPMSSRPPRKTTKNTARGIEKVEITLELADDEAVKAAKTGPSADEYHKMIGGSTPDMENIDLFYRLGLAFAAAGQWIDARSAFETVNRANPGYLDAAKRAEEFRRWEQTVPSIVSGDSLVTDKKSQRYKLLGEIGRGGMAVVYRARDEALERDVALKFLTEQISSDEKMLDMFKREARSAAQLNHPNIVTVYDVGRLDGRDFICMELVSGVTVEKIIEDSGQRMRVLDALRIIEGVLSALEYAHSQNIIHRDIKPSNMMRNDLGVVKLMDFGLAKSIDAKVKKSTIIAGTPSYMPPEQFTGKDMDATSDLFAVGASLYEMLSGEPPFLSMERVNPPRPLSEINSTVPRMLEKLVLRSMEFDKKKRYRSAKEMLQPIRRILASVSAFINKQNKDG